MKTTEKQQITDALKAFCDRAGSQNKASNRLKGVSGALISQVINGNWELIKDEKWRTIANQIGYSSNKWIGVETVDYKLLTELLNDAQENSQVYAVTSPAGSGKTYALRRFEETHANAYMVQCNEFWNRKAFMAELLTAMGRDYSGLTINEMVMEVVRVLKSKENPILLLDEFDKVSDQVLYFFITIYNLLEDKCAIVMCATDHLETRIKRGLRLNKKGYKEIYSRIGRKYVELHGLTRQDVIQICSANGITEKSHFKAVWKDCEGDLRRVKRKIHALKIELKAA